MVYDESLTHYGIRGMRWGKRKSKIYKPDKTVYREYMYVAKNFKTYAKTPYKDLTPEQKKIGKDVALNSLMLIGSLSMVKFTKSKQGQKLLLKLLL